MLLLPLVLLLVLQTAQYALKQTTYNRFTGKGLLTVVVNEKDVVWEKQNRELQIDGRFFDVVRLQRQGGKLFLTGHYDDAETAVWQALERALEQGGAPLFSRLLLLLQCFPLLALLVFVLPPQKNKSCPCAYRLRFYKNFVSPVSAPPPQAIHACV